MTPWPPEHLVALDGSALAWSGGDATALLDPLLEAVRELMPETHAGIVVADGTGTWTTVAATDALVLRLDQLSSDLDEGPALTVVRQEHTVIIDDAESEHRWPTFMRRAVDLGLRSYLGLRIAAGIRTLGALNLYSTVHTCVNANRMAEATLFAADAARALEQARRENDLVVALQSSRTIGKAIGLVMERFDLDDHDAFAYLVRWAGRADISLREIADHLVTQANDLRHVAAANQDLHQTAHEATPIRRLDRTDGAVDRP